jgi:hypothetical protein
MKFLKYENNSRFVGKLILLMIFRLLSAKFSSGSDRQRLFYDEVQQELLDAEFARDSCIHAGHHIGIWPPLPRNLK